MAELLMMDENVPEDAQEILDKLGDDAPELVREVIESAMYAGPVPPPSMMRDYEAALPGMADRIMKMAEREQNIRARDNGRVLLNDTLRVLGSIVVSVSLVGAAVYCASIDQKEIAIALAATGAIPQIVRFFNKSKKTKEG